MLVSFQACNLAQAKSLRSKQASPIVTIAQSNNTDQVTSQAAEIAALKGRADSLRADRTRTVTDMRALRDELESIQTDIAALQRARIATLAEDASDEDGTFATADLAALDARITAIEDALVSQLDGYNLALDLLKTRLDALEEKAGSETLTATTAVNNRTEAALALSAIEAAARRGRPFLSAYQRLDEAMPGNGAVRSLSAVASKAVPTRAELIAAFPDLRKEALDQEAETSPGGQAGCAACLAMVFRSGARMRRPPAII